MEVSTNKADVRKDRKFFIPSGYDDNKIVLMVRDPWTLYCYWEVNRDVEASVHEKISKRKLTPAKSILRVYDVTEDKGDLNSQVAFDFELRDWASIWYVHTGNHGRKWMADIGIMTTTGEFFCLARSNVVMTPVYGMSDKYDLEWMCPEDLFYKMFAVAGGYGIGQSSLEMREMIDRHLKEWISSGGVTSGMFGSASFHLFKKSNK